MAIKVLWISGRAPFLVFQRKVKKCSNLVCKFRKSYYLCNPLFLCETAYVFIIMIFSEIVRVLFGYLCYVKRLEDNVTT